MQSLQLSPSPFKGYILSDIIKLYESVLVEPLIIKNKHKNN